MFIDEKNTILFSNTVKQNSDYLVANISDNIDKNHQNITRSDNLAFMKLARNYGTTVDCIQLF